MESCFEYTESSHCLAYSLGASERNKLALEDTAELSLKKEQSHKTILINE